MFFNIVINNLFLQIKTVQLNMYADDGQLYTSHSDPVSLERRISREVSSANAWFSVNDLMELFGVTTDKNLTSKQHVSSICKKVNNQFSVMTRVGKLISTETMLRLYKAFILLTFVIVLWYGISLVNKILINWTF